MEKVVMGGKEMEQQSQQSWRKQEQEVLEEVKLVAEQPAQESDVRDPLYYWFVYSIIDQMNVEIGY